MAYRKMVLIPMEDYQNLRKELLYQQAPELTKDLYKVHDSHANLPTDQRLQLEGEVISQHIQQNMNPTIQSIPQTIVSPQVLDDSIIMSHLKSFGKINKARANQIYQHLKAYKIQWNEMGQLLDSSSAPIPDSNIVECIDYITNTNRKARIPAGFDEFISLVQESQLPRHLLSTLGITRMTDYKQIQGATAAAIPSEEESDIETKWVRMSPIKPLKRLRKK